MSNEEINYWLETFEEKRHGFMPKDGKKLSFYDTFKTIKELQNNWNELKKWLEENESFDDYCNETTFTSVLDKMQELENRKV